MCSFNTIDDFLRKTYQLIQRKKAKVEMFSQIFLFEGGMSVTKLKKVLTQKIICPVFFGQMYKQKSIIT